MEFANNIEGERIKAFKGGSAFCPGCGSEVIAKCGELKVHHWSHVATVNCDSWEKEPKCKWHLDWQSEFHEDDREVFQKKNGRFTS